MSLTSAQCQAFNDYMGRRPFDWDKKISKDRKPHNYIYTGMYKTDTWESFTGTTHLHEKVYVTRPNDPGIWTKFIADPCVGAPCQVPRQVVSHGVENLRYDEYIREYQTDVFCLDQLNTIEEAIAKMGAIVEGYKELPEDICSDFLRVLTLSKAGTAAQGAGLFLCGVADTYGNPVSIDVSDSMFSVSQGQTQVTSKNSLLINLNANGALTALAAAGTITAATTAGLVASMGMLTMEYLANHQEDLAAQGYHDKDWLVDGKFSITTDATTRRRLLVANPALTQMYSAADFAKGGAFYSFGVSAGCGDWLFKEDKQQMRFRFRSDLDGKDFNGSALTGAVWIEQVWPYENVATTFGLKPQYSAAWKAAPIRLYHCYNHDARIVYVADITSVNDEMKFGLARSFMGKWSWKSPDVIITTDPYTQTSCTKVNDKHNQGYWLGEYRMGEKTIYPEIERMILAIGEPQPYIRVPRTVTPSSAPVNTSDYQALLAYNTGCANYVNTSFSLPSED
jgi:hypothetical protein